MKLSRRLLHEAAVDEKCRRDPLYWLRHWTKTFDEHWQEKGCEPYRPFPSSKTLPYMPWLFRHLQTARRLYVPKSREMMISWAVVGYAVWLCQFFPRTRASLQTQKEEKVIDLINGRGNPGYARTLYEQQPEWMKARHPLVKPVEEMPGNLIAWKNVRHCMDCPKGPTRYVSITPP